MSKYRRYRPFTLKDRTWPDQDIVRAPRWCSVDLRDGNQALPAPMGLQKKLDFFEKLCQIGFREIEVGFPAASETEYTFQRRLIEEGRIPENCWIQVLTQAREHLIEKTVDSLSGASRAVIHLYNSSSEQQRRITFGKEVSQIKALAVDGVKMILDSLGKLDGTHIALEYSPESFSGTEIPVATEICNAVAEEWAKSSFDLIINLPATVEMTGPHVYADQVERFCREFAYSKSPHCTISLHAHNDRGCGIAAVELGLLAGGRRIEGTLFGNGERTGNVDLLTLALNCETQGVASGLDFSDLPALVACYEEYTKQSVHARHPYAGELVFSAFSGSHQDAIKKGLSRRSRIISKLCMLDSFRKFEFELKGEYPDLRAHVRKLAEELWKDDRVEEVIQICDLYWLSEDRYTEHFQRFLEMELPWDVPYLPIDPKDLGRSYDDLIRLNSQSGKGGISYVLQADFGLVVPAGMGAELGREFTKIADNLGRELKKEEVYQYFCSLYLNLEKPLQVLSYQSHHTPAGGEDLDETECTFTLFEVNRGEGRRRILKGRGRGPIDAFLRTLKENINIAAGLKLVHYEEQAVRSGAGSEAVTFIALETKEDGAVFWGVGRAADTSMASFKAVISCLNCRSMRS